jgi:two-component system, NtrC family, sensor kinase
VVKRIQSRDTDPTIRVAMRQQAALARSERLAALGELAARVGHTLRSPLSGVLLSLANLRAEIRSPDQEERLGLAIAELERLGHLLTGLVEEYRQSSEPPRPVRLHGLVQDLVAMARYRLDDGQALVAELPQGLCCRLPETGLRLALLTLIVHAADALTGRPGTIRIQGRRRGGCIELSIRSDGPEIQEDPQGPGLHEPGCPVGGESGLGMATVRRFASANSGRLELSNLSSGGARATLSFPLEESDG